MPKKSLDEIFGNKSITPTTPSAMESTPLPTPTPTGKRSLDDIFGGATPSATPEIPVTPETPTPEQPTFFPERIGQDFTTRKESIKDTIEKYKKGEIPYGELETALRIGGDVAGIGLDAFNEAVAKPSLDTIKKVVGENPSLLDNPVLKQMIPALNFLPPGEAGKSATFDLAGHALEKIGSEYSRFAEKHPNATKDLESIFNIAGLIGGLKSLKPNISVGEVSSKSAVDMIRPKATAKQLAGEFKQGLAKEGILGTAKTEASSYWKKIADKFENMGLIGKNEIQTRDNLMGFISKKSDEIGKALEANKGITNPKELTGWLRKEMEGITDFNNPKGAKMAKEAVIKDFINKVDNWSHKGIWDARKKFDEAIDTNKLLKTAGGLKKEIKIGARDAINKFIETKSPVGKQYKAVMEDMHHAYQSIENMAEKFPAIAKKTITDKIFEIPGVNLLPSVTKKLLGR